MKLICVSLQDEKSVLVLTACSAAPNWPKVIKCTLNLSFSCNAQTYFTPVMWQLMDTDAWKITP